MPSRPTSLIYDTIKSVVPNAVPFLHVAPSNTSVGAGLWVINIGEIYWLNNIDGTPKSFFTQVKLELVTQDFDGYGFNDEKHYDVYRGIAGKSFRNNNGEGVSFLLDMYESPVLNNKVWTSTSTFDVDGVL